MAALALTQTLPGEQCPPYDSIVHSTKISYIIVNNIWHEITEGETKIGRDSSLCSIVVGDDTLSKVHAVIESEGPEDTYIYDACSTNKTKIGKMTLKPHCRYKINDSDIITLGNIPIKFKVMDHKVENNVLQSLNTQEILTFDKQVVSSDKEILNLNSQSPDKCQILGNLKKYMPKVLQSPPVPKLKEQEKQIKKHYYQSVSEASPLKDNFSAATPCEVSNSEQQTAFQKKDIIDEDDSNDDIYNLSTQCEYPADFQKFRKSELICEIEKKNGKSPKSEKAELVIKCDFNDSGTFGFVETSKMKKCVSAYMHESFNEDIFDLATQCPTKLNNSIDEEANNKGLNFKDKINKDCPKESDSLKTEEMNYNHGIKSDTSIDKCGKTVNDTSIGINIYDSAWLNDGVDEELCKVIILNSPDPNLNDCSSLVPSDEKIKTELVDEVQTNISDEIFDLPTQVTFEDRTKSMQQFPCKLPLSVSHIKEEKIIRNEGNDLINNRVSEDGVLTQIFNAPLHTSETEKKGCKTSVKKENTISDIEKRGNNDCESMSLASKSDWSEDFIATQVFKSELKLVEKSSVEDLATHCFDDDVPTQIFPHNFQPDGINKLNTVLEEKSQNGNAETVKANIQLHVTEKESHKTQNVVPSIIHTSDTGDETDSDLEVQLCFESLKKEAIEKSVPVNKKRETVLQTLPTKDNAECVLPNATTQRSSSSNSDKTVSDLDVTELREDIVSFIDSNIREDSRSGKVLTLGDVMKTAKTASSESDSKTDSDLDILEEYSKTKLRTGNDSNPACEDFISTQLFPNYRHEKINNSVIGSSEEIDSDIEIKAKPFPKVENYQIIETSSDEDSCNIEVNSNESESLIKDIEEFSSSPAQMNLNNKPSETKKLPSSTLRSSPSTRDAISEWKESLENDGNMEAPSGRMESTRKYSSGEGNYNKIDTKKETGSCVASDSDETDCEEQLKALANNLNRCLPQLTEKNSPVVIERTSSECKRLFPSISAVKKEVRESNKGKGKQTRIKTGPTRASIPKLAIPKTSSAKLNDSPLKRTMSTNFGSGVPVKKLKNTSRIGSKLGKLELEKLIDKTSKDAETDVIILTQSRKLRNRVIKQKKENLSSEGKEKPETETRKVPVKEKLISDLDQVREVESSEMSTKTKSTKKIELTPLIKNDNVRNVLEEGEKRCLRPRRSSGDIFNQKKWKADDEVAKVVYTGFESELHDRIISKLGGKRVNDVNEGHVLVTDRVRRTVKFLSAVALGLPIVSPKWLVSSEKERKFLDPWNYLLDDKPSEERWGFNLKTALEKWKRQKLLKEFSVYATESARPPVEEILSIVSCCGGIPLYSVPGKWPEKSIVLTCVEDKKSWPHYKNRHVKIVHYEILLSGVLKHFMDFKTYKLR